jgi:tetratricopeptide (TPR) repeat protein
MAVVVVAAAALGFIVTLAARRQSGASLAVAQATLEQAVKLDAALESAPDPAAAAEQRETALRQAEQLFQAVLRRHPDVPEAEMGLAEVAWRRNSDLTAACHHLDRAIALLEALSPRRKAARRGKGDATGVSLLAKAYYMRAGYLVARVDGSADLADPQVKVALGQAADNVRQAVRLDPRPEYQALADTVERLGGGTAPAPLDPGTLEARPATP